jgi:hypothetical protein
LLIITDWFVFFPQSFTVFVMMFIDIVCCLSDWFVAWSPVHFLLGASIFSFIFRARLTYSDVTCLAALRALDSVRTGLVFLCGVF